MDELIALFSGNSPNSVWLYLGLMAVITAFGLYQSRRGAIVVFANYTDVLCTVTALLLPALLLVFLGNYKLPPTAKVVIFLIPVLFVAKATFSYNRSILGFSLALLTKFFLVIIYILTLAAVVALAMGGGRKKHEHKKKHSARQAGMAIAGAAGTTAAFAMLARLGLRSPGFVPLSFYISGLQAEDGCTDQGEKSSQYDSQQPAHIQYEVEHDGKEEGRGKKAGPEEPEGRKKGERGKGRARTRSQKK